MAFLGVDLGSSSCKAAVFTESGKMTASSSAEYTCIYLPRGAAECDPDAIWDAFVRAVRGIGHAANEVEAMCVSTHGETIIPVDVRGQCVGNAIMNSDSRSVNETKELEELLGREKIYLITGLPLNTSFSLGKMMWVKRNSPEIYNRTHIFHSPHSYLLGRMGLDPVCDYTLASRYIAFDLIKRGWSAEILSAADIDRGKMPAAAASGTVCGKLSGDISSLLGLKAGITVAVGGHDQPCASVGIGVNIPAGETGSDIATVSAGTYEVLGVVSADPPDISVALPAGIHTTRHMIGDGYFSFGFFGAGHLSSWMNNLLKNERFDREGADIAAPTNILITPHLAGSGTPHFDANASGVIAGITPLATPAALYRAAYEGIACELANIVEIFESSGTCLTEMVIFGGNARSDLSVQLRAEICNKVFIRTQISDAVARGAARMAARSVGSDIASTLSDSGTDIFTPAPERAAAYADQKRQYKLLYDLLRPLRE